jgi:hypothetical protein
MRGNVILDPGTLGSASTDAANLVLPAITRVGAYWLSKTEAQAVRDTLARAIAEDAIPPVKLLKRIGRRLTVRKATRSVTGTVEAVNPESVMKSPRTVDRQSTHDLAELWKKYEDGDWRYALAVSLIAAARDGLKSSEGSKRELWERILGVRDAETEDVPTVVDFR